MSLPSQELEPQAEARRLGKVRETFRKLGTRGGQKSPRGKAPQRRRSSLSEELPPCSDSRIIVAVLVAEVRGSSEPDDEELLAWLPISIETALESTSDWLTEKMLRGLVKALAEFVRAKDLADPDLHFMCSHEQYTPVMLFLLAFALVCLMFLSLTEEWGWAWPLGVCATVVFALGIGLYCFCIHNRESLVGEDPTPICEHFAEKWTRRHGLSLTFHRRRRGHSYFELKRPSHGTPRPDIENAAAGEEEEDDGWDMVKTPTVTPRRTTR